MSRPAPALNATDRAIVTALQGGFPLSRRPYAEAAEKLGLSESELIDRIARLKASGAITRFGPFFDAAAMGGAFCLCAMAVPDADFDRIVIQVNAFDEVAHNYARAHRLNMWFVLATETPEAIEATAHKIERVTGLAVYRFPKLEEYFIGFRIAA